LPLDEAGTQLQAAVYARLSETYDAAESVPAQLANAERHSGRRDWQVVARLKDDWYSAFEAHDRIARPGKIPGGGPRWFGWTRVSANPERPSLVTRELSGESAASSTGHDNPRSARGLASQPKVVALRKVDANLQEIDAEFHVLVYELLILIRFAYAKGRSASVQVGVDARSGAIARRSGGRLQRIAAGTGGDCHGNAANVSGRPAGADPRGRAGRRAAGHRAGHLD
jgi:hypothetical protein